MTPAEVRALSGPEYIGFLKIMDRDRRDRERAQRRKQKG